MSGVTHATLDLAEVLFPDDDPAAAIQRLLQARSGLEPVEHVLEGLPAHLAGVATGEIGSVVAGLLRMDLVDVFAAGWRKHAALVAAARTTLVTPGEEQVVDLVTHRIVSAYRPAIDLVVDEITVGSVDLELDLTAILHGVCGVVSAGRLVSLRSGRAELEARLAVEGFQIASAKRELDLAAEVPLGAGVRLVDAPA